ncbi:Pkinase domain-containing protein/Stress-antifung domain-containing protein [Cephalotus follicularis]|uniref:Pkinase domain-containing protein/Stress-antifung domain-containing protein n=1 Tax=Cephalotus follicularis TaxID=3775 RepID=A0A1Q3B1W2_CEPFO|nr:Pkinase domain-containing protein/Stress-antifung domain-containing protein [Cephalotus follicularis]
MPSLLIVILISYFAKSSLADPRATEIALICTNETATVPQRQVFVSNFLAAMDTLTPLINLQGYAAVVNGTGNTTVYAYGECMKDLDQTDCNLCFAQCKTQILKCLPFQLATRGGQNFFDGCYLRYDAYDFFDESLSAQDRTVCADQDFQGNTTVFKDNAIELVKNLSVQALKNDGFFVGFVTTGNVTVYGLAQCWELVNSSACQSCLENAVSKIESCAPKREGRVLNAGCYLQYSPYKFYNNSGLVGGGNEGLSARSNLATILAVTSSVVALVLIIIAAIFFVKMKLVKKRRERKQLGALVATVNKSKLNFSYDTLEKATNYFHDSNKLGQGGSGSVYKGILPDGKVVAIKRLFFNTTQWVDHFFNEVNLISNIHHKNLVKLLGCSITGPESLLVYEYVANQNLHCYISAGNNVQPLRWDVRYKIILGTAEGLTYLHEESKLRIIHRDIKLSNIVLDEDFTPKIADFGLARLFPEDKTHISTAIAGTLGYMAPEYIVHGKLTEKADIYSFGVVVIEVVSGKKCNSFRQASYSILQMVWNLNGTGRLVEAVDPVLEGNFEDASRLLKIGLLCVQANAERRPAMSVVVKMLTQNHEIPQPTRPPFLNTSGVETTSPSIPRQNYYSQPDSYTQSSGTSMTQSWIEPR